MVVENSDEQTVDITYFEDGSYMVTTLTYEQLEDEIAFFSSTNHKTVKGTKIVSYRDELGYLQWTFTVYGYFAYDEATNYVKAYDATCRARILNDVWSYIGADTTYSGAMVTGIGFL